MAGLPVSEGEHPFPLDTILLGGTAQHCWNLDTIMGDASTTPATTAKEEVMRTNTPAPEASSKANTLVEGKTGGGGGGKKKRGKGKK